MVEAKTGRLGHLGIAVTFGLVIMAMIYAVGHISGAHFNSAVTFAFSLTRHFPWRRALGYWAAQLAGAILAALLLRASLGDLADVGATLPSGSDGQAFLWEAVLTFFLMFVIMSVATDTRAVGEAAAIAIGGTVGLDALFGGPITGASMNPARSIGPALASGTLTHSGSMSPRRFSGRRSARSPISSFVGRIPIQPAVEEQLTGFFPVAHHHVTASSNRMQRMSVQLDAVTQAHVDKATDDLCDEFTGIFSRETVARFVGESIVALEGAKVADFVPVLAHRFARERLRALGQAGGEIAKEVPEVLFVCVQNAGRSQMAAALLKHRAAGRVHVRTAGSAPVEEIHSETAQALAELGLDIREEFPKPLTDEVVRAADVVVTMGCGDACPIYPGKRYEDWELDDPAGQGPESVRTIRDEIDRRVQRLVGELVER